MMLIAFSLAGFPTTVPCGLKTRWTNPDAKDPMLSSRVVSWDPNSIKHKYNPSPIHIIHHKAVRARMILSRSRWVGCDTVEEDSNRETMNSNKTEIQMINIYLAQPRSIISSSLAASWSSRLIPFIHQCRGPTDTRLPWPSSSTGKPHCCKSIKMSHNPTILLLIFSHLLLVCVNT